MSIFIRDISLYSFLVLSLALVWVILATHMNLEVSSPLLSSGRVVKNWYNVFRCLVEFNGDAI